MAASVKVVLLVLVALGYVVSPVFLIWGWMRFAKNEKPHGVLPVVTFIGFALATASASLGAVAVAYAQVHAFRYYDPILMRIFRAGFLLSTGASVLAISGVWRPSALRWHSLVCGVATAAFWLAAAAME
jgi:hypothetical protein